MRVSNEDYKNISEFHKQQEIYPEEVAIMDDAVVCDSFSIKFDSLLVTHNKSLIRHKNDLPPTAKKERCPIKTTRRFDSAWGICLVVA